MTRLALIPIALALLAAGCGSASRPAASPATTTVPPAGVLQAEANTAATGDIPDNQVFLVFRNTATGYSMKYPEGWAQQGAGARVTFRDKNNVVRVVVARRTRPSTASVRADVRGLGVRVEAAPQSTSIGGKSAIKVVYSSESAPNAVTGKRVKLVVDRYYFWEAGRVAIVDLGTPEGVDNVDAYRLMSESFRWS